MANDLFSIRLDKDYQSALNSLVVDDAYRESFSGMVKGIIAFTANNYCAAMQRIRGKFEFLEAAYLCQSLNSTMINIGNIGQASQWLAFNTEEFHRYGSMGFFTDNESFDPTVVIKKVKELDDFEALAVINSIIEFWKNDIKDIHDLKIVKETSKA